MSAKRYCDNSDTVSSSNNLTKSALTEFPIENNDTIISARNLSRDDALENQKVDNSIPTENSVKEMGLSGEDYSSKETLTTSTLMNNPDRERKSEQHIKLCGSPNFTKPHGLLQSSPIGPNTNVNKGAIQPYPYSDTNNQVLNEIGLAEGESKGSSEQFLKEVQSEILLSNISEKRKFHEIKDVKNQKIRMSNDAINLNSKARTPREFLIERKLLGYLILWHFYAL